MTWMQQHLATVGQRGTKQTTVDKLHTGGSFQYALSLLLKVTTLHHASALAPLLLQACDVIPLLPGATRMQTV